MEKSKKINTKEAKKIIGDILQWQFVLMGIKERHELKIETKLESYSLSDLIRANDLVRKSNERRKAIQEKSNYKKKISLNMTCADRLLAAVYATLHFKVQKNCHVLVNDKMMGIVKARY